MDYREIQIIDTGADKYNQRPSNRCLGRKYDNDAVAIRITVPEIEKNSKCFMIVTNSYGQVLDHIDITTGEALIKQHISRYDSINIGFFFSRLDGYIKNCAFEKYTFAPALDPNATVDIEPEQKKNFDVVISSSFVDVRWKEGSNNTIEYLNSNGDVVKEIVLAVKIDTTIDNLVNYYLKSETYSKDEVNTLIREINSFKKEVVETLPTENIDENTIYLILKQDGSGNDYYDEYLYINNMFEFIGSTRVDLSDYVKFTDYAGNVIAGENAGVVGLNYAASCGLHYGYSGSKRFLQIAIPDEIALKRRNGRYALCVGELDKYVKTAITGLKQKNVDGTYVDSLGNQIALNDEEKAAVKNWLGYIDATDDPTTEKGGVVRLSTLNYGLEWVPSQHTFRLKNPTDDKIANRHEFNFEAVTLGWFDKTLKASLTTNTETLTEEQKTAAQNWLGVTDLVGDINTALESILGV